MRMAVRCPAALLAILAAAALPALAETYKWVDDKGVVNYSNAPPPQAAKKQVVDQRISVVPPDPSLGPAIAAMRERAARQQAYDEADYARRQGYMQAALASAPAAYCDYGADCGMDYGTLGYYPYGYAGRIYNAGAARRYQPLVTHYHRASLRTGGRGAMRGGRGSFR